MPLDPYAIHIHTDGSCYRNPGGESGCVALVVYPDKLNRADERIVDFGCAESTNNRMELMACIKALEWVREHQPWDAVTRVQIVTDSTYVTENVSHRAWAWKKHKWRNRFNKPIANHDLWDSLLTAHRKAGIRVDFVRQPGKLSIHAKAVDKAAKAAAQRGGLDVDDGFRPGAICRSMVKGVARPYPASGQTDVIRPYAKRVMYRGENRISFDIYVETAQAYESKAHAFATPAMAATLHRSHRYRVRFNDDPQYPQIVECIEELADGPRADSRH